MTRRGIGLCYAAQIVLGLSFLINPSMSEGSGTESTFEASYIYDLENCDACNNPQNEDYDTVMYYECQFGEDDPVRLCPSKI